MGDAVQVNHPRVEIHYCTLCGFLLRAGWMAQELLNTFKDELGEVALCPSGSGEFRVLVNGGVVFDRKEHQRFPESKELKQLVRDLVVPDRDLGHSDVERT